MQTKTRTRASTSVATKVALGAAISLAAAFAIFSLKGMYDNGMSGNVKLQPVYGGPTCELCHAQAGNEYYSCLSRGVDARACLDAYASAFAQCGVYPAMNPECPSFMVGGPGYMIPGYEVPGYMPPGYVPPGAPQGKTVAPGYLPALNKRLPPWYVDDNPPDPKVLNQGGNKFNK